MKKIVVISAVMLSILSISAQKIPMDKAVKIGKLDNGLTYYIRHNEEPKGQANFYIAQKVGSILEEENQRGLAHFLEHMCFNGTEHFPGNNIIKYCESIGVKFGTNLNAYTSMDETVYNINNVPVATVPTAIDSCLLILHDWADGLLLTDKDIDQERGVIHEEWRSRSTAQMRMYDTILVKVFPDNRYAQRMPIGTMEVVDNFPYKALRDYYEKWYRPDQQGIIVVGDVDVDLVEAKIKSLFGPIEMQKDPAERVYFHVADNDKPIVSLAKDKEYPNSLTMISFKHDCFPDNKKDGMDYFLYGYATSMVEIMLDTRLNEMLENPQPPFLQASIHDGEFLVAKTKSAFTGYSVSDENSITTSAAAVYREMLRAAKHGFTQSEYNRAKIEMLSQVETMYNQREKRDNESYGSEYVCHFTDCEPFISAEDMLALTQNITAAVPLEVINKTVAGLVGDKNLVIVGMYPDKEGLKLPTDKEMLAAIKAVETEEIAPYVDQVSDKPLISKEPVAGKVENVEESLFGYKHYTLSNGVDFYLKTTDFNKDEVIMNAFSEGGSSLYPDSEATNLKVINDVMAIGGLGEFNSTQLEKVLAGKNVSVSAKIGTYSEGVSGRSTPKDFETMLQLNYLYFTSLRKDNNAFASWKNRKEVAIRNAEANPNTKLQDSVRKAMMRNDVRVARVKSEELANVDYDRILQIAGERFANAADFKFIFTGCISDSIAIPLIEKYIGSLPSTDQHEKADTSVNRYNSGLQTKKYKAKMETPMVTNYFFDNGTVVYNHKKDLAFSLAAHALSIELYEQIREKEGGTYGVSASGQMSSFPYPEVTLRILYQTSPEKYEYLNGRISEIVKLFAKTGPKAENLEKGKKYYIKKYQENQTENGYYSSALAEYLRTGTDIIDGYTELVESITVKDARKAFVELIKQKNHAEVIQIGVN